MNSFSLPILVFRISLESLVSSFILFTILFCFGLSFFLDLVDFSSYFGGLPDEFLALEVEC